MNPDIFAPIWALLAPYADVSLVPIISSIISLITYLLTTVWGKVNWGKLNWALGWVVCFVWYVPIQMWVLPALGVPSQVPFTLRTLGVIIATGLMATGIFSTIKNTDEKVKNFIASKKSDEAPQN